MRRIITATLVCALAGAALAQDLPNGYGVVTPSGSVFTSEIYSPYADVFDSDDYIFQGFPGMTLNAIVKAGKTSALAPELLVMRSDGSVVGDAEGLVLTTGSKSVTAKLTLDATGWWKVRVRGVVTSTDQYTHAVTGRSSGRASPGTSIWML